MSDGAAAALTGGGGLRIATRTWPAAAPGPRANVVLVHGLGEHIGRYEPLAGALRAAGFSVHGLDHRGHGQSQGTRALVDVAAMVQDVDRLVDVALAADAGAPGAGGSGQVFMLGHSLGGMLALRYALAHQDRLAGLMLSGPLAALDGPALAQRVARVIASRAPRAGLIRLDPALVSRDPAVVAAYRADPLVHHGRLPAGTVAEISRTVAAFPATVGAITVPTLLMYGTADRLCPPAGSEMLAQRLGAADLTVHAYPGLFHEILNEPERETVSADLLAWLDARAPAHAPV